MKRILSILCCFTVIAVHAQQKNYRTLIFFFDGLRPDYITETGMPNLFAFSKSGVYGKQHHSVFPTVTRVNSSSYSTGSYPKTHGIMGNTVYFPEVNPVKGLNTGEAENLQQINTATNGNLLTTISIGEVLQQAGKRMMVFSSGSTGQALLQNHKVSGGAIINPDMILPESFREEVYRQIGPAPKPAKPNRARHEWTTDALIKFGLVDDGPEVCAIWLSDPDGAAHADGMGSPAAVESIKIVDEQFGRVINTLKQKNMENAFNIIVSTDHGFVTYLGAENLATQLIKQGLKQDSASQDVVVAEGAIYVKDHDKNKIQAIVSYLQAQPSVGAIFTKEKRPGSNEGWVNGTLSFSAIHWNHKDRAADILVDRNWNDEKNEKGYAGSAYSRGVAGHGGISPYEVHIALLASGPSFKKAYSSEIPTSNVDIVPTVLYLHNLSVPSSMDGRIMYELLSSGNKRSVPKLRKERTEVSANYNGGIYKVALERSILDNKYKYVDFATTSRTASADK